MTPKVGLSTVNEKSGLSHPGRLPLKTGGISMGMGRFTQPWGQWPSSNYNDTHASHPQPVSQRVQSVQLPKHIQNPATSHVLRPQPRCSHCPLPRAPLTAAAPHLSPCFSLTPSLVSPAQWQRDPRWLPAHQE